MSRSKLVVAALGVAVALTGAGCGSGDSNSHSSSSGGGSAPTTAQVAKPSKKTLYLVNCFDANPWCKAFSATFIKKLTADGISVTRLANAFDPVQQSQQFDQAIAQHPGAIAVYASDGQAIVPAIQRAKAAGIPVINLTGNIAPEAKDALVLNVVSNTEQLGAYSAQLIVRGLQAQGKRAGSILLLTGSAEQRVTIESLAALKRELAKTPQYRIVDTQDTQWDQAKAETLATQEFAKFQHSGGIDAVWGGNDAAIAGAIQAARKLGLRSGGRDGIVMVGATCFPVGYQNIKAGLQYGTITLSPTEEGAASADIVNDLFNGRLKSNDVKLDEKIVTADNVDTVGKTCNF